MTGSPHDRVNYLWGKYITSQVTESEYRELAELLKTNPELFSDEIGQQLYELDADPSSITQFLGDTKAVTILDAILHPQESATPVRRIFPWQKWVAAASIILALGITAYFIFFNRQLATDPNPLTQEQRFRNDIQAPGINKATLRLANGQLIILDTVQDGSVIAQADKISDGELVYNKKSSVSEMLTLAVPRGSTPMKLGLSDGTAVWLNAGSSITYPSWFTSNQRNVSITGEAYFEVAKVVSSNNGHIPFIVNVDGKVEVEVLGTHFNINAYDDENTIRTTLLEGSVRVRSSANSHSPSILLPGQQALINQSTFQLINPDIEEVMAWKNGLFRFKSAGIKDIMRQLSRWYDLEVEYKGEIPKDGFNARINRNEPVSELLKILELTEQVHFAIDGRKVTVLP